MLWISSMVPSPKNHSALRRNRQAWKYRNHRALHPDYQSRVHAETSCPLRSRCLATGDVLNTSPGTTITALIQFLAHAPRMKSITVDHRPVTRHALSHDDAGLPGLHVPYHEPPCELAEVCHGG